MRRVLHRTAGDRQLRRRDPALPAGRRRQRLLRPFDRHLLLAAAVAAAVAHAAAAVLPAGGAVRRPDPTAAAPIGTSATADAAAAVGTAAHTAAAVAALVSIYKL